MQYRVRPNALILAAALAGATSLLALYRFDPATSGFFPPCPFLFLTGYYCPGCGTLRALHQLLEGNLVRAFAMNPLAFVCLPFLLYPGVSALMQFGTGQRFTTMLPAVYIRGLAIAILLFGVLRNLPMYPFYVLAPGGLLR
jgi:uncharacterized protein DUF2752